MCSVPDLGRWSWALLSLSRAHASVLVAQSALRRTRLWGVLSPHACHHRPLQTEVSWWCMSGTTPSLWRSCRSGAGWDVSCEVPLLRQAECSRGASLRRALVALLLSACAVSAPSPASNVTPLAVVVPELAGAVVADGVLQSEEWAGAEEVRTSSGSIRLGLSGKVFAIAVELEAPGIATVLLAHGSRVWLLHASAALGTAQYTCSTTGSCTRVRKFAFSCREMPPAPGAAGCRSTFRDQWGWVANVQASGARVREFLIDTERFVPPGQPLQVVVTALRLPDRPQQWPLVADDSASLELQAGNLPDTVTLTPRAWVALVAGPAR